MTQYDLGKVVGEDGVTPTIDSTMSDTSTNPVQNKIVKKYIDRVIGDIDDWLTR